MIRDVAALLAALQTKEIEAIERSGISTRLPSEHNLKALPALYSNE
jgi:hypothetical protein